MQENVKVRDIVIGMGACTNSAFGTQYGLSGTIAPIASYELLSRAVERAKELGFTYHVGNLLSSDTFYSDNNTLEWNKLGVLAVEMEAAGLYMNAMRLKKNALAICTVSDHLITNEATSSEERQSTFKDMITLALEVAISL